MQIHHIAIWVRELEKIKDFYCRYFNGNAGEEYFNPNKNFRSCFISFGKGSKIELMHQPGKFEMKQDHQGHVYGLTHIAISVGSKQGVDDLTERLREDGFTIAGKPRVTGDGFYESVILDPEGNRVEIAE